MGTGMQPRIPFHICLTSSIFSVDSACFSRWSSDISMTQVSYILSGHFIQTANNVELDCLFSPTYIFSHGHLDSLSILLKTTTHCAWKTSECLINLLSNCYLKIPSWDLHDIKRYSWSHLSYISLKNS